MYFADFPKIYYNFIINGKEETRLIMDITKNVRLRKEVLSKVTLFDLYTILDGETPEYISEKIYGRADYHWAILLANDMYDYLNDFPISQHSLERVISDKYGEMHILDIHHYETIIDGKVFIVDKNFIGNYSVTNIDYEYSINEGKRLIKIISPTYISQVAKELRAL